MKGISVSLDKTPKRFLFTLLEIFIFCPKFFWVKTRENVVVLDFLAVDNFDFTRKIVKKIWGKTRENVL